MNHNKLGLTVGAWAGAAFVFTNVGSFATPVALTARGLAGLALLVTITAIWRRPEPAGDVAVVGGHALPIVIIGEVVAIVGGLAVLNGVLDTPGAGVAWIATVVGVHFFALAKLWGIPPMNWLAAAMTGCGLLGGLLVLVDAGQASVDAVAGVLSGAVLLAFPWSPAVRPRWSMRLDRLILFLFLVTAVASCSAPAGNASTDREAERLMRQLSSPRQSSAESLTRAAIYFTRNDAGSAVLEAEELKAAKIDDPLARMVFRFHDPGSLTGFIRSDPVTACYQALFNHYGVMGSAHRVNCPKDAQPLKP